MTAITPALSTIQQEETDYRSGVSEALLTKIGGAINWINANAADQVADIKHSFLTEAQFQSLRGTTWVLCDGRSVVGSDYETLTGNSNIPDVRGRFMRMKDNGRSLDPQGDSALETERADIFKSHRHRGGRTGTNAAADVIHKASCWGIAADSTIVSFEYKDLDSASNPIIENTGDSETAPKHIVCNYFVKISE